MYKVHKAYKQTPGYVRWLNCDKLAAAHAHCASPPSTCQWRMSDVSCTSSCMGDVPVHRSRCVPIWNTQLDRITTTRCVGNDAKGLTRIIIKDELPLKLPLLALDVIIRPKKSNENITELPLHKSVSFEDKERQWERQTETEMLKLILNRKSEFLRHVTTRKSLENPRLTMNRDVGGRQNRLQTHDNNCDTTLQSTCRIKHVGGPGQWRYAWGTVRLNQDD